MSKTVDIQRYEVFCIWKEYGIIEVYAKSLSEAI